MLFSVSMSTYTLSCPVIGMLAKRERFGPRAVIVTGLLFQLLGFLLIGPSPLLKLDSLGMGQLIFALGIFGMGEAMSMTPVMDDMMQCCGEHAEEASNSLAALMASAFALGQMIGPMLGSTLTARIGFAWACTLMASVLCMHLTAIAAADSLLPRPKVDRLKEGAYTELSAIAPRPVTPSSVDD